MTTVDKAMADKLVAREGKFVDDPQVVHIVEYDNAWGGKGYGLEYAQTRGLYAENLPYIRNPKTYWSLPS